MTFMYIALCTHPYSIFRYSQCQNSQICTGKLISCRWPVADELHAFGREFVMQHTERIEEPLAVSQLIAKPIQRNNFTFEVQAVELIPDRFPVFLRYPQLTRFIREVLAQDPRPAYHKGEEAGKTYAVWLHDFNVRWRVTDAGFEVFALEPR